MPDAATLNVAVCPAVTVWFAGGVVICGPIGLLLDELDELDEPEELDELDELDELSELDELDELDDAVRVRVSDPGELPPLPPQADMSVRARMHPARQMRIGRIDPRM